MAGGPLQGFKVIEMAAIGPAPLAGMLLADMGAQVLRIDRLGEADLGIQRDPRFDVASRGTGSQALDLESAAGREVLLQRGEHVLGGAAPWSTVYATRDGRHVSVCAIGQRCFAELPKRLDIDPHGVPDRIDRANWPALRAAGVVA